MTINPPTPPPLATVVILDWLVNRLHADAVLADLAIETSQAYEGVTFPYILITVLDPGVPHYNDGARAITRNGIYLVRGVCKNRALTNTIKDIAARIIFQLHKQRDGEAGIASCILRNEYYRCYPPDEQTYTDLGGVFGISADG